MKKNSQSQIDFVFESVVFYPIEIPIFYKVIKRINATCSDNNSTDLKNYLTYLEPRFKLLFQNISEGKISSINMIFHIYEVPYICVLIDTYLIDEKLPPEKEKYLYDILDRFEYLYYKHFSRIKPFCLYPITKKKYLLKEIQKEKKNFFKV